MRLSQLYQDAVRQLRQAGVDEAETDTALLLEACLKLTRSDLILRGESEVETSDLRQFQTMLNRRILREPSSYITGWREFWSLDFVVNQDVLIPRPETEFLLETALKTLSQSFYPPESMVLDLCTGSGAIAVVLAQELPQSRVIALDSSINALRMASLNINRHRLKGQIGIVCSDLFAALQREETFQVIVTNPPYVMSEVIDTLQPEVCAYEPRGALDGGLDGLRIIRQIVAECPDYLQADGWLFMEIGDDQEDGVLSLFKQRATLEVFDQVTVIEDWAGKPRVLKAHKAS